MMRMLLTGLLLISSPLWALNDTEDYTQLQNCMAEATEVVDNGSYERFCIDRYLSSLAQQ